MGSEVVIFDGLPERAPTVTFGEMHDCDRERERGIEEMGIV
jgi:hypothetical protein